MKKIKLITTLSSLGIIGAGVPIVATSCSKSDDDYDHSNYAIIDNERVNFPESISQDDINNLVTKYNDEKQKLEVKIDGIKYDFSKISEINIGTTHNVSYLPAFFLCSAHEENIGEAFVTVPDKGNLKRACLAGIKDLIYVERNFLAYNIYLDDVKLPSFTDATFVNGYKVPGEATPVYYTTIFSGFMANCPSIKTVDFSPLANVGGFYSQFMYGCTKLQSVNFSALKNVYYIEDNFLSNCSNLSSIILPTLKPHTEVDSATGVASTCLPKIGGNFLYNVWNISSIDFSPFAEVWKIGYNFYPYGVTSLKSIDLSSWKNVSKIGHNFLSAGVLSEAIRLEIYDSPVESIKLPTFTILVKESGEEDDDQIGDSFLAGFSKIKNIDLTPLALVESIGGGFMYGCVSLDTVDLSPLTNIKSIGTALLGECNNLTTVNMGAMGSSVLVPADAGEEDYSFTKIFENKVSITPTTLKFADKTTKEGWDLRISQETTIATGSLKDIDGEQITEAETGYTYYLYRSLKTEVSE